MKMQKFNHEYKEIKTDNQVEIERIDCLTSWQAKMDLPWLQSTRKSELFSYDEVTT